MIQYDTIYLHVEQKFVFQIYVIKNLLYAQKRLQNLRELFEKQIPLSEINSCPYIFGQYLRGAYLNCIPIPSSTWTA